MGRAILLLLNFRCVALLYAIALSSGVCMRSKNNLFRTETGYMHMQDDQFQTETGYMYM